MANERAPVSVLYLLRNGPERTAAEFAAMHAKLATVKVIDLTRGDVPYARLIEEIFAHDKVISW